MERTTPINAAPERLRRTGLQDAIFFVLLTLLVWGLTAPWQGLFQDDAVNLFLAQEHGIHGLFLPVTGPLRRLCLDVFVVAAATPRPLLVLELFYGLVWMGHGLVAGWITSELRPDDRFTRVLVVVLVLTATSDFLTASLVALTYNLAVLWLLVAVGAAIAYCQRGGWGWLLAAVLALAASMLTVEIAICALPLLPALFLVGEGATARRRTLWLLLAFGLVLMPMLVVAWRWLHDPTAYPAIAMPWHPLRWRIERTIALALVNVAPWRWPLSRPPGFGSIPAHLIGRVPMVLTGLIGGAAVFWRLARTPPGRAGERRAWLLAVAIFALAALLTNAVYAGLQMADLNYRTHVLSRVWTSLALGWLGGGIVAERPRWRAAVTTVALVFVVFGVWGGLERQDYFLASWRQHRRELASLLDEVPGVRPDSVILLRSRTSRYLATAVPYLTRAWMGLLYAGARPPVLRDDGLGAQCRAATLGVQCWDTPQGSRCAADGTCSLATVAYEHLVVLDFDEATGRYRLVPSLAGDPLGGVADARYAPRQRIVARDTAPVRRRLGLE